MSLLCPCRFSRQEYWSGLPCPPPGAFPNPGIELVSLMSPALAGGYLTTSATWATLHSGTRGQSYQPPASDEKERNTQACKRLSSSRLQKRSICSLSSNNMIICYPDYHTRLITPSVIYMINSQSLGQNNSRYSVNGSEYHYCMPARHLSREI